MRVSFGRERDERSKGEPTLEFVFADVDGGRGVDYVGGEVVNHCFALGLLKDREGVGGGEIYRMFRKEVGGFYSL